MNGTIIVIVIISVVNGFYSYVYFYCRTIWASGQIDLKIKIPLKITSYNQPWLNTYWNFPSGQNARRLLHYANYDVVGAATPDIQLLD